MKIFKGNRTQETVGEGTEIDLTVGVETIQERTTETTTGMEIETTIGIEAEIVETTAEIETETEVEEETDQILEREEEINPDLDQVKDTLTKVRLAVFATEVVT